MIDIKKDRKANDLWTITRTDAEGFHRQLSLTTQEMDELVRLWSESV